MPFAAKSWPVNQLQGWKSACVTNRPLWVPQFLHIPMGKYNTSKYIKLVILGLRKAPSFIFKPLLLVTLWANSFQSRNRVLRGFLRRSLQGRSLLGCSFSRCFLGRGFLRIRCESKHHWNKWRFSASKKPLFSKKTCKYATTNVHHFAANVLGKLFGNGCFILPCQLSGRHCLGTQWSAKTVHMLVVQHLCAFTLWMILHGSQYLGPSFQKCHVTFSSTERLAGSTPQITWDRASEPRMGQWCAMLLKSLYFCSRCLVVKVTRSVGRYVVEIMLICFSQYSCRA